MANLPPPGVPVYVADNLASASFTSGASSVVLQITGEDGVAMSLPSASNTLSAVLTPYCSVDGTNYLATQFISAAGVLSATLTVSSAAYLYGIVVVPGSRYVKVVPTTYTSGSATVTLSATIGGEALQNSYIANASASLVAKATQGTTAVAVQDFKDSGRTYFALVADAVAGATTETLLSCTLNVGGATTASTTSYTVTAGKTLRIQAMNATVKNSTTTAAYGRIRLRSTTGTVATTSGIIATIDVPITGTTTSATTAGGEYAQLVFPDGVEIPGGSQIAVTEIISTTSSTVSVSVVGYQY